MYWLVADFNGTRAEALKEVKELGGDPKAFNARYDNITINDRAVKGLRLQGEGKPIKINYADVVDRYQGSRSTALDTQRHGDNTFPKSEKGKKIHHLRPPSVYQTFFEGLNSTDAAELARYSAEDLMTPLGDADANAGTLNQWEHDQAYHNWDRSNDGVKPTQTQSTRQPTGDPNTDPVRNFEMPKEATLDQRKAALKVFIQEGPQRLMDEQLYTARMASKHPNHPDVQRQFLETFNVGSNNKQTKPPEGMDLSVTNATADPTTGRIKPSKLGQLRDGLRGVKPVQAVRAARGISPLWSSLPLGLTAVAMSGKEALASPTAANIEDVGWDTANLVADAVTLIPTPWTVAGGEGLQKTLGVAQQARIGQRELAKQEGLPEPIQKFVEDPLNELEYAGKSALSFLGNALRMGSEAGY